ncbi:MAG TPA: efflux RND transporter periplasmic adaptor subunit [Gammaproteobacteria bacterium]|nr:efflux RND transporter periplasmic adaptor subunit [Gammaproteobacteria bacterium]
MIVVIVIAAVLAAAGGYIFGTRGRLPGKAGGMSAAGSASAPRKVLYWKAPMDPNFHSDKPGKSPMGMDLVPVYANDSGDGEASDVRIDSAVINNLGVRTVEVQQGALAHRIEAVGYVAYDEDTITSISTRADGWVEKLGVKSAGDVVRPGQLLYELFSPKLATAEREYLTALSSGIQSLIGASRERMHALGFTTDQIEQLARNRKVSDRVARRADRAGVVVGLGVSEGAYVMPATQVMKLADLGTVWVLVEVDESEIALLRKGQKVVADFEAFPGQRRQGSVDYIYPDINPMTRTAKVRLRFANPDRRLQPNMYAHVVIQAAPQQDVVHIPSQALIRTGHNQRVIVALGNGRFDVCPVQAGFSSGDQVAILKGLRAGQWVVTSAQFMIDSEANVDAAGLRLGAGKPGCTQGPTPPDLRDVAPGQRSQGAPSDPKGGRA